MLMKNPVNANHSTCSNNCNCCLLDNVILRKQPRWFSVITYANINWFSLTVTDSLFCNDLAMFKVSVRLMVLCLTYFATASHRRDGASEASQGTPSKQSFTGRPVWFKLVISFSYSRNYSTSVTCNSSIKLHEARMQKHRKTKKMQALTACLFTAKTVVLSVYSFDSTLQSVLFSFIRPGTWVGWQTVASSA